MPRSYFNSKTYQPAKALQISALLGVVFSVLILITDGFTSVLFVAALGIANALVRPAVWPLTLVGLGNTQNGICLTNHGIAGRNYPTTVWSAG